MPFERGNAFRPGTPFYILVRVSTGKGICGICRYPAGGPRETVRSHREW
jgi:hypothetical protein